MATQNVLQQALARCPAHATESLESFLDGLLDEELDTLAQLPGTPGQVLAAQFTYYARSSTALAEPLRRQAQVFQGLADALGRLQAAPKPTRRKKTHANPSHTQAAGGS